MGYSLVAISMMILYCLALIYREIFSKVTPPPPHTHALGLESSGRLAVDTRRAAAAASLPTVEWQDSGPEGGCVGGQVGKGWRLGAWLPLGAAPRRGCKGAWKRFRHRR